MNNTNQAKAEEIFVDLGRRLCGLIGWREAIGQVYALLFVRSEPLSLDDIADATGLSKSNVWGIIQQLQDLGAARKIWTGEKRKDYFIAERDFNLILTRGIFPMLGKKAAFFDSYLENAGRELAVLRGELNGQDGSDEGKSIEKYQAMLDDIAGLKNNLQSLVGVFSTLGVLANNSKEKE